MAVTSVRVVNRLLSSRSGEPLYTSTAKATSRAGTMKEAMWDIMSPSTLSLGFAGASRLGHPAPNLEHRMGVQANGVGRSGRSQQCRFAKPREVEMITDYGWRRYVHPSGVRRWSVNYRHPRQRRVPR